MSSIFGKYYKGTKQVKSADLKILKKITICLFGNAWKNVAM